MEKRNIKIGRKKHKRGGIGREEGWKALVCMSSGAKANWSNLGYHK